MGINVDKNVNGSKRILGLPWSIYDMLKPTKITFARYYLTKKVLKDDSFLDVYEVWKELYNSLINRELGVFFLVAKSSKGRGYEKLYIFVFLSCNPNFTAKHI